MKTTQRLSDHQLSFFDTFGFLYFPGLLLDRIDRITEEFEKIGFKYVSCNNCSTLFVSPRPSSDILKKFYSKSPSSSFWVNEFFMPVAEVRREKIFKPRAEYISKILELDKRLVIGDIGAGFCLFLEELKKMMINGSDYYAIEPSVEMSNICQRKGIKVKCMCLEDINDMDDNFDLLTAFELIEHLFDPISFFKKIYSLLRPGGIMYITSLNGKGFETLLLWEQSKSISPPHHLNFFNTGSIRMLLENIGFKIMEISTPGKLDWEIVEGAIKRDKTKVNRFWDMLANEGCEESKRGLQDWIAKYNLSSHMSILAGK